MLLNKWGHFMPVNDIKQYFADQPAFNPNDFFLGLRTAYTGFFSAWNNPKIKDTYWGLVRTIGASMILLYSVAIVSMIFLLPLLVFFPGWVFQILSVIPLWSYSIAKKRNPLSNTRLFLDELWKVDPTLADEIAAQLPQQQKQLFNTHWVRSVFNDTRTSLHFAKLSAMVLALSAIPFIGPVLSFFLNYYLISEKLGWEMLSIYTQAAKRMDYKQTRDWMNTKKWAVIGFGLPFALASSIPFGGPLLLGYAQAASAHLFVNMFSKESRAQEGAKISQG